MGSKSVLDSQALAVIRSVEGGLITPEELGNRLKVDNKSSLAVVNSLLKHQQIELLQSADKKTYIKAQAADQALKLKGLTTEELLVYQTIQRSGNQGTWTRDLKRLTNLPQTQTSKMLKTLEERQLIKSVKSVHDSKRKIYVLFDVTPATELTGGLWFQNGEMDTEFINILQQQCKKLIMENRTATLEDVTTIIGNSGISNVALDEATIDAILQTLVWEGVLERKFASAGSMTYSLARVQVPAEITFTSFPCGVCPVRDKCVPGGKVSPETCVYLGNYLDF